MTRAAPRAKGVAIAAILAALSIPATGSGATPRSGVTQEYDLKAAFLFNFAQFVEWPIDAFAVSTTPITIGVLGDDPFGAMLDALVAGETIRKRPLLVRRYRSVEQIAACHILFVSSSEASRLDHIAKALAHRSILTVGESKDFAARAGIIGFELSQRRLRLQINLDAAADARLTISSKLLRQARVVRSSAGGQ
jgi:uncharacterized protein DUF4154